MIAFFDDMGAAIDRLIEEKFPALHAALDLTRESGFLGKAAAGWSMAGDAVGEATGIREWLGTGEHWGSGKDLLPFLHGSDEENIPTHAAGRWTASGAHQPIVGERGQEFVTNAWASQKIASTHPGALEAMNAAGRLPVSPFAVPVPQPQSPAASQPFTFAPTVVVQGAGQTTADIRATVREELDRTRQELEFSYATPSLRGAR